MKRLWADPVWREQHIRGVLQQRRKHSLKTRRQMSRRKKLWWKLYDNPETRRKIGLGSKGRPGLKREKSPMWKGGRWIIKRDGYAYVIVEHGTPGAKTNGTGTTSYMLEHRLVMQNHLGRTLRRDEDVHHRNGVKHDNRLENLMLVPHKRHFEDIVCPHCGGKFSYH